MSFQVNQVIRSIFCLLSRQSSSELPSSKSQYITMDKIKTKLNEVLKRDASARSSGKSRKPLRDINVVSETPQILLPHRVLDHKDPRSAQSFRGKERR